MSAQGIVATPLTFQDQTDDYTLTIVDAQLNTAVRMNKASANNLYVPTYARVPVKPGTQILVKQEGAGQTTIAPQDNTVTINVQSDFTKKLKGQYAWAFLVNDSANVWSLAGDLEAA